MATGNALAQEIRQRCTASRFGQFLAQGVERQIGAQVDPQQRVAIARNCLAQWRGQRIDRTAFDAVCGDHRFAAQHLAGKTERDALERCASMTIAEQRRPFNPETTVSRLQRRDRDIGQQRGPAAIGAKPWP